jgi:hypothetical protein
MLPSPCRCHNRVILLHREQHTRLVAHSGTSQSATERTHANTVASLGATQNFFAIVGRAQSPTIIGVFYGITGSLQHPLVLIAPSSSPGRRASGWSSRAPR